LETIGIIGLGLMGTALAQRLLHRGLGVLGYDLSAERRDELVQAGGQAAGSAVEVARQCETILLSLPDSDAVNSVIESIATGLRAGQLVIDTTTGEPLQTAATGARLAQRGVRFLDATIAGSSVHVSDGQVIVMVGGSDEAFRSARELLASFSRDVFHVGPWGSGSRMKLVVNLALGLNRAALAEALVLAKSLELDPQNALAILKSSPAYSTVMDTKGPKMLREDFEPEARLSQHLKDVRLILQTAARTGLDLPLSTTHRQLLERAEAAGLGELDNSAIIRALGSFKSCS
jgi:3-hydroxyisobutyrate dehydrogenase-like beta-hydroxyacid dehydrogenase